MYGVPTKLFDQVSRILERYPKTRNSDFDLRWKLWEVFYPELIHQDGLRTFVYKEDEESLPNQDDIKRIRAHIQNDLKKFIPTSWVVARQRKWLETEWRSALGYPVTIVTEDKLSIDRFKKTVKTNGRLFEKDY